MRYLVGSRIEFPVTQLLPFIRHRHRFPIHVTRQHAAILHVTGRNPLLQIRSARTLRIFGHVTRSSRSRQSSLPEV